MQLYFKNDHGYCIGMKRIYEPVSTASKVWVHWIFCGSIVCRTRIVNIEKTLTYQRNSTDIQKEYCVNASEIVEHDESFNLRLPGGIVE